MIFWNLCSELKLSFTAVDLDQFSSESSNGHFLNNILSEYI